MTAGDGGLRRDRLEVGDPHAGGRLSGGVKGGLVWVNCFVGTGVTVDISPEDAELFADWLYECAARARVARDSR